MIRDFFIKNRNKYFDQVETDSVSVLFSGNVYQKSADSDYPFEVNKNFYYLTGINQANSKLIMVKGKEKTFTYLFIDEYDELQAKWVGKTLTSNEATDISGIDEVLFNKDFNKTFSSFINPHRRSVVIADKIYLDLERRVGVDSIGQGLAFSKDIKKQYPEISLLNNYHIIVSLRMIKEDDEIRVIKKSIETTKNALKKVMENLEPDLFENQIEAIFDMAIKWENKTHAFDTICASGKNATILHYVDNNQRMINGDLVLFDLGA
ncbi:MAG: aminopeptidase P N-terminal domain-containing protein, partial [Bacilli bacterium]